MPYRFLCGAILAWGVLTVLGAVFLACLITNADVPRGRRIHDEGHLWTGAEMAYGNPAPPEGTIEWTVADGATIEWLPMSITTEDTMRTPHTYNLGLRQDGVVMWRKVQP